MTLKNKYSMPHFLMICFAASISALGTIPYGFEFAHFFASYNYGLFILTGIMFATCSALANAVLGIYSFLNAQSDRKFTQNLGAKYLSFLSAIPVGFMCYFGYDDFLPITINLVFSITVTIINAAIAYTAILNLIKEIKTWSTLVKTKNEALCRLIGFIIGAMVSLVAYMSATHGITELLLSLDYFSEKFAFKMACIIAFITWLPYAALFANATQIFSGKIYYFIRDFFGQTKQFNLINMAIFLFALLSGSAFAQIAIVFFNPDMYIPHILKTSFAQHFIYHFLVPFAFISSVAVNYLALKNFFGKIREGFVA